MELEKIKEIIAEKMDIDASEIDEETTFASLKVDSPRYGRDCHGY